MRISEKVDAVCTHCGSRKLSRPMSRFAMPKSEEARMDALSDPSTFGNLDENDPKSVPGLMRKLGKEMGEEMGRPETDQAIDELERGNIDGDESSSGGRGSITASA
jgi:hypothetical protein